MEKLKVIIVEPSQVYLRVFTEAVQATQLAVVVGTVQNGMAAIDYIKRNPADIVLLDVALHDINSLEVIKWVKQINSNVTVIMLCSGAANCAADAVRALELGAMDFIVKPTENYVDKSLDLIRNLLSVLFTQVKIKRVMGQNNQILPGPARMRQPVAAEPLKRGGIQRPDLIVIASSTGGPVALEKLFSGFTKKLNKPVLVVQHMPPEFTQMLAQTLAKKCVLPVIELDEGMTARSGQIVIARGGYHMVVNGSIDHLQLSLDNGPAVNSVRPSADVLFESVACRLPGINVLAVVLTGMGSDGANGIRRLKQYCNCHCITQNEKTCVVYGMPRSIHEAGMADESLPLQDIAGRIMELV